MLARDDEALQTDAYIDALLAGHAGRPVALPEPALLPPPALRQAIDLLETGLPRIHPSFRFEQQLAARLRVAALSQLAGLPQDARATSQPAADLLWLRANIAGRALPVVAVDRRLLVGGAIASGVSLAGAAVIAWRMRERNRPRRGWLA